MNLCLVCRDITSESCSGLARSVCDLAQALADRGHWVALITGADDAGHVELRGVQVFGVGERPASSGFDADSVRGVKAHAAAVYREVARLHAHERPVDAVLTPLWRSEGMACLRDDRFATVVSCMTSLVTLTELDPLWRGQPDIARRLALERATMRRSRYLHGLTNAALCKCIADYELDPAETAVIGRGLHDRTEHVVSTRIGAPANVLFVGRLERRKGVDTLLEAARLLIEDDIAVTFTFAGPCADPSVRAAYDRDAESRPALSAAVRFADRVSDEELHNLYAAADIVCAPSRYESHGVVLIEAMMFGKALATCDAGGIAEVVEADRNALVSAPGDARALASSLRRLVADDALRARLGTCARATYDERFRVSAVAGDMEAFLARVISRHRRLRTPVERSGDPLAVSATAAASRNGRREPSASDEEAQSTLRRLVAVAAATPPAIATGASGGYSRVTAVVVSRNRPALALRALDSVARDAAGVRTLVIDNGSAPEALSALGAACAARPNTEFHASDRNLGCAGGRRLAVGLVDREFVLFLDDDAELAPGALAHLMQDLDTHPAAGAVCATVVNADGRVFHSGGSVRLTSELAEFDLIGAGALFGEVALPPTGPTGWVPGTAVLVRRELLVEFPIDDSMSAYYEDNEWCHRVRLACPGCFRRSREALVLHRPTAKVFRGNAEMLTANARFYERHGLLLVPPLFDVVPELVARDGTPDLANARLLLELVCAKGTGWALAAWSAGELTGLLQAHGWRAELRDSRAALADARATSARAQDALVGDVERLRARAQQLEATLAGETAMMAFLQARHETLQRVEAGGWWRLRKRLAPALRAVSWLRTRVR